MIRYFLENRISAIMLCASLVTAGIVSLTKLPVSLLPGSDYPALSVIIEYPGVAPDKIESLLTKPVERIIKTVNGISEIESVSEEGKSRINITFQNGTDIKIASVKIRGKIGLIKGSFPREVQEPVVMRYDPSERPVVVAAAEIRGVDRNGVREIMEKRVKPALQRIEGISEIIIAGGELREIHIETDRGLAEGRGLIASDISEVISSGNISIPAGTVEGTEGNRILYIPSGYRSLFEISNSIVNSTDGKGVRVNDVAVVQYGSREKDDLSRYNGLDMVTLYIHKGGGANTLDLCRNVKSVFDSFQDVEWKMIFNQGEHIESSVDNALFSGLWGILIVIFVLSVFFRKKETVIPVALAIPASILIVPSFMYLSGRGINIMTISGFALSAGMVVDNGIVVIDAIKRGSVTNAGVLEAVNSVRMPIISSTCTTISVFIPVMLLSRKTGETYGDMAFTITAALLISLFFALVLLPSFYHIIKNMASLSSSAHKHDNAEAFSFWGFTLMMKLKTCLPAALSDRSIKDNIISFEKNLLKFYKGILGYSFRNSFKVTGFAIAALFIALVLFTFISNDSVADSSEQEFYLYLEFPTGTSLERTDSFVADVEKMAQSLNGVLTVSTKTEKWRGTLTIKPDEALSYKEQKYIREELKKNAGAMLKNAGGFAYISEADEIASREVSIHFVGDDTETLKRIARAAASKINSIDGIDQCMLRFREGRPEYTIVIDREAAGRAGVSHAAIAETSRNALFGPVITKYTEKGHEVDVRLRMKESDRDSIEDILAGSVRAENGVLFPLSGVVTLFENEGLTKIFRLNGRRSCSITARIGSLSLEESEKAINSVLQTLDLPEGYTYQFDRRLKEFRDERRSLIFAVLASMILIYMILASLFESFSLPLLVMVTLPFAVTGVAPVLFITGIPLSPAVFMGLIMLAGIVMNNGILLVESVRRAVVDSTVAPYMFDETIMHVAYSRFRPVIITAVTAILGMLPMVISTGEGSSLWRPFAVTVTSGLLFSTILTLIILPVLCGRFYKNKPEVICYEELLQETSY